MKPSQALHDEPGREIGEVGMTGAVGAVGTVLETGCIWRQITPRGLFISYSRAS